MKSKHIIMIYFLIMPVVLFSKVQIIGKLIHEQTSKIGEQYSGTIEMNNAGEEIDEVKIYQTDYFFNSDGLNYYGEPGLMNRSNAAWIDFSPNIVQLPPNSKATVTFTVTVPEADSLVGTFWSLIMVEPVPKFPEDIDRAEKSMSITTVFRYAIQIVTDIGETGTRQLTFKNAQVLQDSLTRTLSFEVHNTGQRYHHPQTRIEIYNQSGDLVSKLDGTQFAIFPGCSKTEKIALEDLEPDDYKLVIIADCGDNDVFGVQYNIRIE